MVSSRMGNLERKTGLNSAQREIVRSEDVFSGSALNTISVGMFFGSFRADKVASACNKAMASADVFSASLIKEAQDYFFYPHTRAVRSCLVGHERTRSEADEYLAKVNAQPMNFPEELYTAEAFDLAEGGSCLVVRFHHVLIDGFGMSLFAQRVADALEGRELTPSVFFDGSSCEQSHSREDADFWRTVFSENDAEPAVFGDKATGFEKTSFPVSISQETLEEASAIAKRCGVSLPYVYAAAYAIYLRGATGKTDAVFLMARRNRGEAESQTVGCYTLVVPVRIHIAADDRFDDVCRKLSAAAKQASSHKSIGYSAILKILREEHGITEAPPLYGFNWYSRALQSTTPIELCISTAGEMQGHLTWNIFAQKEGLTSSFDLRNGIYDEGRAHCLIESLCGIVCSGKENSEIGQIQIVAAREKEKLSHIRGAEYETDGAATIPSLFRDAARRNGDAVALYAGAQALTFSELDELTDTIAKNLIVLGVCRGDKVAFMLKRDITLIPTLLGISKSGAAFIPVDPAYPKDRIEHILTDSHAKYLISETGAERSGGIAVSSLFAECQKTVMLPKIAQNDLAYMIYTSGTTGKPKGVMLSHKGIVNITHPENNPFNKDVVKNGHGIVAIGSICFDISLFEIFVPLFNGKFVVLGNELAMRDASALADCITKHNADILHCTPSRIAAYLKNSDFQAAIRNVRMILSAGEVLPGSLVLTLKEKYGIRIYNGYGPTETTIGATISVAGDHETIGAPIGNTGIALLNAEGKQVPYGAVGEICVYGNGVGLGYYGREDETRKKFTDFEGLRIYRTGDLGHLTADGRLMYHGRCDRQIKLRGLRIELSEIEAVMLGLPGIGQAACLVKKTKNSEHLVGFYTCSDNKDIDGVLKAHMKRHLTEYMVPELLVRLSEMPQTPGGKLDTRALDRLELNFGKQYVAPRNQEEKVICEAFAEITDGAGHIGAEDNFFESGMDSLSASLFLIKIEEKLQGITLEYGDIYSYPTAELLAARIQKGKGHKRGYPIEKQDYTGFDRVVNRDITSSVCEKHMGNILLTGATGYLGIHMLLELLRHPQRFDKVICIARPSKKMSAVKRVRSALFYYGEEDFSESYGSKWEVVEGDVTDPSLADKIELPINTVLHTAANVAHFAHDDSIEKTNVGGVRSMIEFALRKNACLCHVSTISVAGVVPRGDERPTFSERDLYVGQKIHNQYIWSKYLSEYEIMRAAIDRGLAFKIMRVGNLQGRISDGEFQMNMKTNNFTRCLSSYVKMGFAPQSVYGAFVNFSPVDEVARMIVALSAADRVNAVYHVSPEKETAFADIFAALKENGREVKPVSDSDFEKLLDEYKRDPDKQETVEALLAEKPDSDWCDVPITQEDTLRVLCMLGKQWAPITDKYLNNYIGALAQLDMFD